MTEKTQPTNAELLPCPFCGTQPDVKLYTAQAAPAWKHHARKLTQWLHCMSHNDSYFGEPAGLVKQVTGELNRLIGAAQAPQQEAQEPITDEVRELIAAMVSELREHRWCGDCYPENGWPGVNRVLADYARFKRHKAPQPAPAVQGDALDATRWRTFTALPHEIRTEWVSNLSLVPVLTQWVDQAAIDATHDRESHEQ